MNRHWISIHIFYNNDPHPVLVDCVLPLVALLRERRQIDRYFFIRYWEGGPHVRLRLAPAEGITDDDIKQVAEPLLNAFLRRRPSLFDHRTKTMGPMYAHLYEVEYGKAKLLEKYGPDGEIPYFPNNSFCYVDYEPEWSRYGGEVGMELAERHFEVSSDIVLAYLHDTNTHVRSVRLGQGFQILLHFCLVLLQDRQRICRFLDTYVEFWKRNYFSQGVGLLNKAERSYGRIGRHVGKGIREIVACHQSTSTGRTRLEHRWIEHAQSLRDDIVTAVATKRLQLPAEANSDAIEYLLTSYIHMTANRLGISIADEVYLAYLIRQGMENLDEHRDNINAVTSGLPAPATA